jgi:hypothetical protein
MTFTWRRASTWATIVTAIALLSSKASASGRTEVVDDAAQPIVAISPSPSTDGPHPSHSIASPVAAAVPSSSPRSWYGWQTLLSDALVFGVGAGLATDWFARPVTDAELLGVAAAFALIPPIIHLAHGRPAAALADFGVRVAAPVALAGAGMAIDLATSGPCDDGDLCLRGLGGLLAGGVAGLVLAVTLDAAGFAWTDEVREPVAKPSTPQTFHLVPTVAVVVHGMTAGVAGVF